MVFATFSCIIQSLLFPRMVKFQINLYFVLIFIACFSLATSWLVMVYSFCFLLVSVQAHAASAVLNFSENCTPDILTPYLDGIVGKLLLLLQVC